MAIMVLALLGIVSLILGQIWAGVLLILFGAIGIIKNLKGLRVKNFQESGNSYWAMRS